jgi:hypothetical protein
MTITIQAPGQFAVQNFLVLPLDGVRFLVCLSGIAKIDLSGQQGTDWHRDGVDILFSVDDVLRAMGHTPSPNHHYRYALHQWLPLMMPNAFTDLDQAVNFGVAVDRYSIGWQEEEPHPTLHTDVAARDVDTTLHRIGYMVLLVMDIYEVQDEPAP